MVRPVNIDSFRSPYWLPCIQSFLQRMSMLAIMYSYLSSKKYPYWFMGIKLDFSVLIDYCAVIQAMCLITAMQSYLFTISRAFKRHILIFRVSLAIRCLKLLCSNQCSMKSANHSSVWEYLFT